MSKSGGHGGRQDEIWADNSLGWYEYGPGKVRSTKRSRSLIPSTTASMATLVKSQRATLGLSNHARLFSVSLPTLSRRPKRTALPEATIKDLTQSDGNRQTDSSSYGHLMLQQQRQLLYYMRLIEHEMPQLVAYRKPFVPPPPSHPLVIRSVSYGGEAHPVERKRTVVVPVARLPLKDGAARHKFKLLAGVRWTPEPPKDSGISVGEKNGQHGFVKISCEDFPLPAQNLKWVSDTLDRLIGESNKGKDKFSDLPLDTRHLEAKVRKTKGRGRSQPSIKDFPKEWLPVRPSASPSTPSTL
ncbi:mitochondrial ribosomal subunit protein-domain-containing protein [Cytidiella melzeri]|nr:mitochondrial ribosomal subunit protein-domain-containing protein [Cytidiella melzeri]